MGEDKRQYIESPFIDFCSTPFRGQPQPTRWQFLLKQPQSLRNRAPHLTMALPLSFAHTPHRVCEPTHALAKILARSLISRPTLTRSFIPNSARSPSDHTSLTLLPFKKFYLTNLYLSLPMFAQCQSRNFFPPWCKSWIPYLRILCDKFWDRVAQWTDLDNKVF